MPTLRLRQRFADYWGMRTHREKTFMLLAVALLFLTALSRSGVGKSFQPNRLNEKALAIRAVERRIETARRVVEEKKQYELYNRNLRQALSQRSGRFIYATSADEAGRRVLDDFGRLSVQSGLVVMKKGLLKPVISGEEGLFLVAAEAEARGRVDGLASFLTKARSLPYEMKVAAINISARSSDKDGLLMLNIEVATVGCSAGK